MDGCLRATPTEQFPLYRASISIYQKVCVCLVYTRLLFVVCCGLLRAPFHWELIFQLVSLCLLADHFIDRSTDTNTQSETRSHWTNHRPTDRPRHGQCQVVDNVLQCSTTLVCLCVCVCLCTLPTVNFRHTQQAHTLKTKQLAAVMDLAHCALVRHSIDLVTGQSTRADCAHTHTH